MRVRRTWHFKSSVVILSYQKVQRNYFALIDWNKSQKKHGAVWAATRQATCVAPTPKAAIRKLREAMAMKVDPNYKYVLTRIGS